jgi:hypothetical protein
MKGKTGGGQEGFYWKFFVPLLPVCAVETNRSPVEEKGQVYVATCEGD